MPDLQVRFSEEEIALMLKDGIIQKIQNERYKFTELGEKIIREAL